MAKFLRKHAVRVMVLGIIAGAITVIAAALFAKWTVVAITGAGTLVLVAGLVLAVSRRQLRAMKRVDVATQRAILNLHQELTHERVRQRDIDGLRATLGRAESAQEQNQDTLAGTSAALVRTEGALESLLEAQQVIVQRTQKVLEEQARLERRQDQRLARVSDSLLSEAQALSQLMAGFEPTELLPTVGGWALSPSGLLWLTRYIAKEKPEMIVECGSGTSTLWCAMALRRNGHGRLVAMDHKPDFAAKTRDALARHGLSDWAEVVDAPLVPTATPRGNFDWYDTTGVRASNIDLLLVDGPPQATGQHARYPALFILEKKFAAHAAVLLDDTHRADERECMEFWLEETPGLSVRTASIPDVELLEYRRP